MPQLPRASVIVCTCNRAPLLAQACESLLAQDYPEDLWELIVVDNGSSDDTLEVAERLAAARPDLVRVLQEPRAGLSRARNAGIRAARGEIVAFADDDAFPVPGWLRELVLTMLSHDALAAGGPVEPIFQGELPSWFHDLFLPYLAVWEPGDEPRLLRYNDYPRGNNMALRREVFARFGEFSPDLGRVGGSLLSCEETELCLRIERGGGRIVYAPGARIRHVTAAARITSEWLARRFLAQGRSEAILEWRHAGWPGLRAGWLHWYRLGRHAAALARNDGPGERARVLVACHRRALLGHTLGAMTAALRVPRYRPTEPAAPWLPFQPAA